MTVTVSNRERVSESSAASKPADQVSITDFISLKQPNYLRKYSSVNYVFTLACLTPDEVNNPAGTYRITKPRVVVFKSSGGTENKVRTAYEVQDNSQFDYFIDNVEIETIIAPTEVTRVSNALSLKFEVYEPYSMGLFLQTLQLAAIKAGYENYNRAPYALFLEFVGYTDNSRVPVVESSFQTRRVIPMKFSNIEFEVTEGGSKYTVNAFPWNEQALGESAQTIKHDVTIKGNNISTALETGEKSLTKNINDNLEEKNQNDALIRKDEYIVLFPSSLEDLQMVISQQEDQAASENQDQEQVQATAQTQSGIVEKIRELANDESRTNQIGLSKFNFDFIQKGDTPFGKTNEVYDGVKAIFDDKNVTVNKDVGEFTFPQGTTMEKVIEEMIIMTEYGQSAATAPVEENNGNLPWYRIQTHTYIVPDEETLKRSGEHPKLFVYIVMPYYVHSSAFSSVTKPSVGIESRKNAAAKEYNYIYTGKNEDILDFSIVINNAYYQAIAPDNYKGSAGNKKEVKSGSTEEKPVGLVPDKGQECTVPTAGISFASEKHDIDNGFEGGSDATSPEVEVARRFNEAVINSRVDLITLNLTIMGDPYYISDTGLGNYNSMPDDINPALTKDGAMNYQNGEVDVVINFKTPIDYNSSGRMVFPEQYALPVTSFSGLYRVIKVENTFQKGQFKQVLELVRRPLQDEVATTNSCSLETQSQSAQSEGIPNDTRVVEEEQNTEVSADKTASYGAGL